MAEVSHLRMREENEEEREEEEGEREDEGEWEEEEGERKEEEGEREDEEGEREEDEDVDMVGDGDGDGKGNKAKNGDGNGEGEQDHNLIERFSIPRTLHFHHFISYMPVMLEVGPVPTILHTFLPVEVAEAVSRCPGVFSVTSSFIKESEWTTYFDFISFRYRYRKLKDRKLLRDGHNIFMRRHGSKINASKALDPMLHSPENPFVMVKLERDCEKTQGTLGFSRIPESMGLLVLWIEFRHTWQHLEPGATRCPVVRQTLIPRPKWEKRLPHLYLLNLEKYTNNPDVHARLRSQQKDNTYIKTNLRHALDYAGIFTPCDRAGKKK